MTFDEYKKEQLKDPEFAKAYDEIQPEMNIIRAIIQEGISQNLTQHELSERTGIDQGVSGKMAMEDQRYGRNKSTLVNKTYIESGGFRNKFDKITDNPKLARFLCSLSKEILFHRSGTQTEDMYWIDGETGEVVTRVIDQSLDIKHKIVYTDAVKKAISGYKNLITIHNHPSSMPPSINDFNTYHQRGYGISLVICHDGTIYQYRSEQWVREKLCDMYVASSIMEGYDEREAQIIALNKIKENHKIDFWEVNADE